MQSLYQYQWILILCLVFAGLTAAAARAQEHGEERATEEQREGGVLELTAAQLGKAGVVTAKIEKRPMATEVIAPGEVTLNTYRSAQVTPRIEAQVISRHARLGQTVKKGEPLVTLSSVAMANAQGNLIVANREWRRLRKLGSNIVSARRYVTARVANQTAYAKVLAFGMTPREVDTLLQSSDATDASGKFDLTAPQDGIVISDDFVLGEVVRPGRVLFEISDESVRWVEAHLQPDAAARVKVGAPARVSSDGKQWQKGTVVLIHPQLEENTRTRAVRIEVHNNPNSLRPGQFVRAAVQITASASVIAVPRLSVVLMRNAPTVFKAKGGAFRPQQVKPGQTSGGWTEIRAGLHAGDSIAVKGLFFLKSLVLKSEIGEE